MVQLCGLSAEPTAHLESHLLHKKRELRLSFFFVVDGPNVRVVGWADGTPRVPSTPHPPQVAPLSLAAPLSCYLLANSLPTSRYMFSSTASSAQNLGWFFPRQCSPWGPPTAQLAIGWVCCASVSLVVGSHRFYSHAGMMGDFSDWHSANDSFSTILYAINYKLSIAVQQYTFNPQFHPVLCLSVLCNH